MDFIDQLRSIGNQVSRMRETVQTEEATKQAFILPFLNALGYNVFDPTEVVPELCADVGVKKGEKVDYAIMQDGKPIILIEAKYCGVNLDTITPTQLYRYFSVTQARIGVLTNGIIYRFFSDLEEPNKMDHKPFLEMNILDLQEPIVNEVKRLNKASFQVDDILSAAVELKYTKEIRKVLAAEMASPSEDLVRFFTSRVYTGRMTPNVKIQFTELVKRGLHLFVSERLSDRLKTALAQESGETPSLSSPINANAAPPPPLAPVAEGDPSRTDRIVTTPEELEAYYIVKSILRDQVDPSRIAYRDAISYFTILLDNNNRKTICRLYIGGSKQYLVFMTDERKEDRVPINSIDEIYSYADRIREALAKLEGARAQSPVQA